MERREHGSPTVRLVGLESRRSNHAKSALQRQLLLHFGKVLHSVRARLYGCNPAYDGRALVGGDGQILLHRRMDDCWKIPAVNRFVGARDPCGRDWRGRHLDRG